MHLILVSPVVDDCVFVSIADDEKIQGLLLTFQEKFDFF